MTFSEAYQLYGKRKRLKNSQFRACAVRDCEGNAHYSAGGASGLCKAHYYRNRRHGFPEGGCAAPGAALKWIEDHIHYQGDDCLPYPFATDRKGYGVIYVASVREGSHNMQASRFMCIKAHGEPPTLAHHAAHSCGNGHLACTNPKHLRWATALENVADQIAHGTFTVGERSPNAKLTERDIIEIRSSSSSQRELAQKFGVSQSQISSIRSRLSWKWVTP